MRNYCQGIAMLVALVWVGARASVGGPLTLTQEGSPRAAIVLASRPVRAAQFAALELQYHLRLMTGVEIPIVREPDAGQGIRILVGQSQATKSLGLTKESFASQEYLIRFLPKALVLVGRDKQDFGEVKYDLEKDFTAFTTWPDSWDEQGTAYAVYDFLERYCGVRWFNPTEAGMEFPRTSTLTVQGKDVRRKPFFKTRWACVGGNSEGYDAWTGLWPDRTEQFKEYEAEAYADLHKRFPNSWAYLHAKRATILLFLARVRAGGEKCVANHSLYGFYQRFWEPAQDPNLVKLFVGKRPDMFAKGYEGTPPQMCYTSRELIQQVVQDARNYFDRGGFPDPAGSGLYSGYHWGENYFAVEPMDNSSFCKCDRCQAWLDPKGEGPQDVYSSGKHSDYFFNFVNEVAKEVRKTHPDKRVVTLAYMTHAYPPKKVRLDPNVVVMYCFASNRLVYDKKEYANDLNALREWVKQYSDRPMYLWLYYTFPVEVANNGQWFCFPGYFAHKIDEQIKLFRKYKMGGMFHCGYGQEVEAYVTYRLMDDPTLKVDALLNEYFRRYYGGAAGPMKKLYLAIENTYCDPKSYPPGYHGHESKLIAWDNLGTESRMAQFGELMAQARSLAATEAEKERMKLFDMATWSYMVAGQRQHLAHKNAPIPSVQVPRVAEALGDPARVDWSKSVALGGSWYDRGQDQPADRRLSGRLAHDGKFLYMELTDPCDTAKLSASPTVFCYDDWEIFVAAQRAEPYRQYAVGPTGLTIALSHGEVNFRRNVEMPGYPMKVIPDTSVADRWISRLAFPLADLVKDGVRPGGKFYMNILRVSGPEVAKKGGIGIDTWISYCSVHDVDRLGEIRLQE